MIGIDAIPSCRFYVELGPDVHAVFTEVSGLQVETQVEDIEEGGNNGYVHRLPGHTTVGNLTLKRGMSVSKEFFLWYIAVTQGRISRRNVSLVLYDVAGRELQRWNFLNAFPVKWIGPQLSADGAATAVETLELAHDGLRPG